MEKSKKIQLWYGVFLGVLTLAVALAYIVQVADIYYGGPDPTGHNYTAEVVWAHLIVPLSLTGVWALAIIAGFVLSVVFPVQEKRLVYSDNRKTLARLKRRMPQIGEGESFAQAEKAVTVRENARLGIWCGVLGVGLIAAVFILAYVFNPAHYMTTDFNGNMLKTLQNVMPWVGTVLVLAIAATVVEYHFVNTEIKHVKTMIATGDKSSVAAPKQFFLPLEEKESGAILLAVRIIVGLLAVAFIIAGAFNEGAEHVLMKAINICMECIGLG